MGKANIWFDILEKISPEDQQKLAKEIDGKTICGEHITNDNQQ